MINDRVFFKSLDTLRFFAFFIVYCQHAFSFVADVLKTNDFFLKVIRLMCNGAMGVSFFFVLSGFLITFLLLREQKSTGKINVRYFYIRRTLRIWPLFYAVVIFAFFIYPSLKHLMGFEHFEYAYHKFMHFVFLNNFDVIRVIKHFPGQNAVMVSVTWSVAIEEQFYLVWPLLFSFIPSRFYKFIFPTILGLSMIFRFLNQDDVISIYFHTFSAVTDLATGAYGAYLVLNNKNFLERITRMKTWTIVVIYLAGFYLLLNQAAISAIPYFGVLERNIETLFFIFIILEQNFSSHSFKKYSDFKILANLGTITYGLYMLHPICLLFVDIAFRFITLPGDPAITKLLMGIIGLFVSIVVCKLSYRYYESFFLKLKNRFAIVKSH